MTGWLPAHSPGCLPLEGTRSHHDDGPRHICVPGCPHMRALHAQIFGAVDNRSAPPEQPKLFEPDTQMPGQEDLFDPEKEQT